jgi:multidrug efflux pump subunit AcrB
VIADVDLAKTTSRRANEALRRHFADIPKRFPGYELIFGGEEEQTQESLRSLFRSFGVALLLDFVILAALFRSYVQPLIILTTIPIGLLGVLYALFFHGAPASFMALLGVVAMTGVVVNNAIVLVDCINNLRESGLSLHEAVIQAGCQRLRPIAASSITTLLGLFPTAYGFGGYEPFVAPMALALAWGLTFAMPMTLFLIPAVYVFVITIQEATRRYLGLRTHPLE